MEKNKKKYCRHEKNNALLLRNCFTFNKIENDN